MFEEAIKHNRKAGTRLLYVMGMRRSGHHAIVNWARGHVDTQHKPPKYSVHLNDSRVAIRASVSKREMIRFRPFTVVNFEDKPMRRLTTLLDTSSKNYEQNRELLGEFDGSGSILVIRNPFNCLASRIKHPWLRPGNYTHWKEQAKEHLGYAKFLPDCLQLKFEEWFESAACRQKLSSWLGWEFSDLGLEWMSGRGGGSSFDKMKFKGAAQKMTVSERWRSMLGNDKFVAAAAKLLADEELVGLYQEIYGPVPAELFAVRSKGCEQNASVIANT